MFNINMLKLCFNNDVLTNMSYLGFFERDVNFFAKTHYHQSPNLMYTIMAIMPILFTSQLQLICSVQNNLVKIIYAEIFSNN